MQERGRREQVDGLRGNFPHPGLRRRSRTGPRTTEIAANCDPSADPRPQPDPYCSLCPNRKFHEALTGDPLPLGAPAPGPAEAGAVAQTRTGSSRVPLALECEAGLASLQFWGLRANFFGAEPHGLGVRVRPGRKVV